MLLANMSSEGEASKSHLTGKFTNDSHLCTHEFHTTMTFCYLVDVIYCSHQRLTSFVDVDWTIHVFWFCVSARFDTFLQHWTFSVGLGRTLSGNRLFEGRNYHEFHHHHWISREQNLWIFSRYFSFWHFVYFRSYRFSLPTTKTSRNLDNDQLISFPQ